MLSSVLYIETTAAATVAKVAVKRIPSYDYKARFNDLSEKHKVLREKYAQVESKVEDAERMEQEVAAYHEEVSWYFNRQLKFQSILLIAQAQLQINLNS